MTAKKKKPTDRDTLREQLHETVRDLRELQAKFQRMREAQAGQDVQAAQTTCAHAVISKPVSLTRLADDLELAVDALQAGVTRLETRLLPLLPDEQGVLAFTNVRLDHLTQSGDTTMTSQLLLSIAHLQILTSIIDELTNNINL